MSFKRWNISAAVRKMAIWIEGEAVTTCPTWSAGSAVPTANEPKGSFYSRTGGAGAGQVVYVATDSVGTWVALAEAAATDVLAESTPAAGVTVDGLLIKDGDALFVDNDKAIFGTGSDITMLWDATKLLVGQAAANSAIDVGVDGAGIDVVLYGDTASANLTWDQSADKLLVQGAASVQGLRTTSSGAVAITTTRAMTLADSGGIFSVAQSSAYDIDLPSPTSGPGCRYLFYLTAPGAFAVTITVTGSAATFVGIIANDITSVIPATGGTLTFASGAAALGDTIEITSITTGLYHVRAIAQAAGGITIA